MNEQIHREHVSKTLNEIMVRVLNLGQASVSEHQFRAYRKLVMDFFAEGKRNLGKDRCGESKDDGKGGVSMSA